MNINFLTTTGSQNLDFSKPFTFNISVIELWFFSLRHLLTPETDRELHIKLNINTEPCVASSVHELMFNQQAEPWQFCAQIKAETQNFNRVSIILLPEERN